MHRNRSCRKHRVFFLYLVLLRHDGKYVAGIIGFRFQDGIGVFFQNCSQDFKTGDLYLGDDVGVVDAFISQVRTVVIGFFVGAAEVFNQGAVELSFHDGFVVAAEYIRTSIDEFVDDACPQKGNPFIFVRNDFEGPGDDFQVSSFLS